MEKLLHIIPAAGKASRIGGIPKFLLPIASDDFLIKFHLKLLQDSNLDITKVIVVSSEYFETINRLGLDAQIIQADTKTMNETIKVAIDSFPEHSNYLLTMPDTYYKDRKIIENLVDNSIQKKSQISLGLWKIQESQKGKLGQVLIENENITDVVDKDPNCQYLYAWGSIVWNKSVNHLINIKESHLGYILKPALNNGINIDYIVGKENYYDCGTFDEYSNLLKSNI